MAQGNQTTPIAPGISITNRRVTTSTDDSGAQVALGTETTLDDGTTFKYYLVREAIALGQIVTNLQYTGFTSTGAASDNTVTAPGATFTSAEYDGSTDRRREYYVFTTGGTGPGQSRRIVSNTATVLTLDTAWTTAVDATTTCIITSPYAVNLTTGAAQHVVGVAVVAVTNTNTAWFQIRGKCQLVRCVGTTDPTILHRSVMSSSTGGACKGPTAAGITATEAEMSFGFALAAHAAADAAARGVLVELDCRC